MRVTCTKAEAASRQLDVAIWLLLGDHDPLAIRTLTAAAHGLFADLVEHEKPGDSWRSHMIQDSGLSKREAQAVLNKAQNYLKHADRDPASELSFDEHESDDAIFMATLECSELGKELSPSMQAFQIWYLACYPEKIGVETDSVIKSRRHFSGIDQLSREGKLVAGLQFLHEVLNKY